MPRNKALLGLVKDIDNLSTLCARLKQMASGDCEHEELLRRLMDSRQVLTLLRGRIQRRSGELGTNAYRQPTRDKRVAVQIAASVGRQVAEDTEEIVAALERAIAVVRRSSKGGV